MNTFGFITEGVQPSALDRLRWERIDDAGNPVEPFTDDEGGWPLRCCLTDSLPGDRLAIVAHAPFPWNSAYRETGPVVIHADRCAGTDGSFPEAFEDRDQILRAFGDDDHRKHTQIYDLHRHIHAGEGIRVAIDGILDDPRVEFVHAHNVISQCYSFTARRPAPAEL
jgi:hypothetical protein